MVPAAKAAAEDDAAVPIAPNDAVLGDRLAPITIVVFSDFQCPYCVRFAGTLDEIARSYGTAKLRVVFKNKPLPFHDKARLAAEVGQGVLELAGADAFWRFHAMAFRKQPAMSHEALRSWAIAAGADGQILEEGLRTKRWAAKVDADLELAKRLDVGGTPSFFVNGMRFVGAQPLAKVKLSVEEELRKAEALDGPKDEVYRRMAATNLKPVPVDEDDEGDAADRAAEAKLVYKVPVGTAPSRGPSTALVTIIEFSDFECRFCKRFEQSLARLRTEYGDRVRVVWRDLPARFHPRAEPAALLARAARAQKGDEAFWAVHAALFDAQPNLQDADLERTATEARLDVPKAMNAVKVRSFRRGLDDDFDVADDFSAVGTPHSFVNGRRFVGAQPYEKLKALVDEEIARAEALIQAGAPRASLYEALVRDGKPPAEPLKKTLADAPKSAPFRGAANAPLVIQEVADFECPFCKRADATMDELLKAYPGKLKIVWRDRPLGQHKDAPLAAEAAREAHAQLGNEGFTRMQKLLFENQTALERDDLDRYAGILSLDMKRFARSLDEHVHRAAVDADEKLTGEAGVSGAPAFFVGPYFVSGAAPYPRFRKLVDLALSSLASVSRQRGSSP